MPTNPKFVRLVDRLTSGMYADLDSGWSISGYDVKSFPEDDNQGRVVRAAIHAGILEAASQAEHDEIREADEAVAAQRQIEAPPEKLSNWQENRIQEAAKATRAKLREARAADAEDEEYDPYQGRSLLDRDLPASLDEERRAALLEEAEDEDLGTDDPEVQVARSTGQLPRGAKKAAKAKKSSKRGSEGDSQGS